MTTEISFPDLSLIQAIKDGNEKALGIFYKQNFGRVMHLVQKNSGSDDDAKDIYQEAMIEVILQIKRGKLDQLASKLSTYLYSICYHKWIDRLRRKGRRMESSFDMLENVMIIEEPDEPFYTDALEKVLGQIGDKCRNLLTAFYFEKLPMTEIAGKLGFADQNSAKSQKNKCMDKARGMAKNTLQQFYQ